MDEALYKSVYEHAPAAVMLVSATGGVFTIQDINRACENLLGATAVNAAGHRADALLAMLTGASQVAIASHLLQAIKEKGIISMHLAGPDGDTRPMDITIKAIDDSALLMVTLEENKMQSLIAEQQRYEKFLRETQQASRSGTWEINLLENTSVWSDGLKELHELPADYQPSIETSMDFYTSEAYRQLSTQAVTDAIAKGQPFDIEVEIRTAKGKLRWLRSTGSAEMKDGMPVRIFGTAQDITDIKETRQALIKSNELYQSLLQAVEGVVWEADAQTFAFTFISESVTRILGYTPQEWLASPTFWKDHIYKDDTEHAVTYCHAQTQQLRSHSFDYRMIKADGTLAWIRDFVSVVAEEGKPHLLRGIMVDITASKLLADMDHLEKEVLEMSVQKDVPVKAILHKYVQGMEQLFPDMKCSVMAVNDDKLYSWAAPSLPASYLQQIEGLEVGPLAGSCGAAAYAREVVIVSDIATDVRWAPYKQWILPYGLKACWSHPVMDTQGDVIAVMGVYYDKVKTPTATEMEVISRTVAILKLILEYKQYSEKMQEMNMVVLQGQSLANFGSWQWDISNNKVTWSDVLYKIYGLDKKTFKADFEGYLSRLHPDDKARVQHTVESVLHTHEDVVFEERIVRPDGEVRHLKSWGRLILNSEGEPQKMIGACLDITAAKETENKMQEIAWQQSHVVRAPLATLMGLVNLLEETSTDNRQHEILQHIKTTATQLDDVIRSISQNTSKA